MIAPLWKRWAAGAVDALPFALPFLPFLLRAHNRQRDLPAALDLLAGVLSGAYQVSATVVAGQTLGQRALGIRVVDHRTGGVPTLRQAALRWAIFTAPDALSLLTRRLTTPKEEHARTALKELEPAVNQLREQYGRDRQGLDRALTRLYEERGVNPMEGCLRSLVSMLPGLLVGVFLNAPALRGPLHQGIPDRVCQTVVIEAPGRARQLRRPPSTLGR